MVDILLATYNGGRFLGELLDSIKEQTYTNWHLIIRDDSSSDNTENIIKDFAASMPEGKVTYNKNVPSTGSAKCNFMKLLGDAEAPYVMFCDQDDIWHKDKIEKTLEFMKKQEKRESGPVLVHTDLRVVNEKLEVIHNSFMSLSELPARMELGTRLVHNNITGCTMMINAPLLKLMKKASKGGKYIVMHDHFAALIAEVFGRVAYLNEQTIDYRQHGDNSVGATNYIDYIKSRLLAGKDKFRADTEKLCLQARYFLHLYKDETDDAHALRLLRLFGGMYRMNKIERMHFCLSNKVLKAGMSRAVMQLLWI